MINEDVERRVASYYMANEMPEDHYQEVVSAMADLIWQSDEKASDDQVVEAGLRVIQKYIFEDEVGRV